MPNNPDFARVDPDSPEGEYRILIGGNHVFTFDSEHCHDDAAAGAARGTCRTINAAFQSALAKRVQEEREACAEIALAHGHIGPFSEGKASDRIASYSTKTCELIAQAIRSRKEKGDLDASA